MDEVKSASTLSLRYAADPMPLSAVCRNQEGSFPPSEAAISCLDFSAVSLQRPSSSGGEAGPWLDTIDCGRDLEPSCLDTGLCCHESVPLRDSPPPFNGGLGIDGSTLDGGGGRGRAKSRASMAVRLARGDIDPDLPRVLVCSDGDKATGGSIPWFDRDADSGFLSAAGRSDEGVGPVLEGDSDLARSDYHQHMTLHGYIVAIPALLACLSLRACSNSSSVLFDRSASSGFCFELKLAIRARN
jgi:hypothetical protein